MLWIRCLILCEVLLLAHCRIRYFSGRCKDDEEDDYSIYDYDLSSTDPKDEDILQGDSQEEPPEMGHSYIAKYEMSSLYAKHSAWVVEYFDFKGKRAKISATVLGMEFVDYYDYGRGTVTSYRLQRPESSGWSSKIEDTCTTVEMAEFTPTLRILSYPVLNFTNTTASRAFRYGPMYNYTFKKYFIGVDTRNIPTDKLTACIHEDFTNYSLRSEFYWGHGLSFSYPSGEERIPLFIEMRGNDVYDRTKEVYIQKYVSWYQKDPKFTHEMFEIPKGLHWRYEPKRLRLPNVPSSFSYSFEETQFELDNSSFLKGGFQSTSYKQVWYDHDLKLARIDMRPTADDLKELGLKPEHGPLESISALFDLRSGFTYISNVGTSECLTMQNNTNFFWKHKNGTPKTPEELFGINSELQYKGKGTVMGVEVEVWTELMNDTGKNTITKRDLSFSVLGKRKDMYTNKYLFSLLQESTYEEKYTTVQKLRDFPEQKVTVKNFLEFNSNAPKPHVFGQHACIPEKPTASYYMNFKPENTCDLDASNKTTFLRAFLANFTDAIGLNTTLTLQNLHFVSMQEKNISVGFTFHEGIQGEETNETSFYDSAMKIAGDSSGSLTVSFRLNATSQSNVCSWKPLLFQKVPENQSQPGRISTLTECPKCSSGSTTAARTCLADGTT